MATSQAFQQLREQAIALRRAGKSRREIKELLGITSNWTLNESLRGEPPLPQNFRPNAKDDVRGQARTLRRQGHSYTEIASQLGVSKSSVSLWARDLPRSARLSYEEFPSARPMASGGGGPLSASLARLSVRPRPQPQRPRSAT